MTNIVMKTKVSVKNSKMVKQSIHGTTENLFPKRKYDTALTQDFSKYFTEKEKIRVDKNKNDKHYQEDSTFQGQSLNLDLRLKKR